MLDIQLLRKDLPAVVAGLKRRGVAFDEAGFRALEDERKSVQARTEELQAKRNTLSKQIGMLKGNETKLAAVQEKLNAFLRVIPNIPRPEVPEGKSEADNVELRRWGTPR